MKVAVSANDAIFTARVAIFGGIYVDFVTKQRMIFPKPPKIIISDYTISTVDKIKINRKLK